MTDFIPRDKLTAYQRWEMAAFDEAEQAAERAAEEAARQAATSPVEPEVVPEPVIESVETEAAPVIVLPTAAEIEQMHADAHEQGYAAGYAKVWPRPRRLPDA